MPRVTAILPNYNYARYLKERVRSVLDQTVSDLELVYVDDASTDESNRVIQDFVADPRVTLRLFEQNSGTVYQRWNEAAAGATGEWLWFPNADDSAHPRFLERLLALTDQYPNVGIAHCRLATMDGTGRIVAVRQCSSPRIMERLSVDCVVGGAEEVTILTAGLYLRTASAVLLRHADFLAAGGFDARLWGVADYDLYLRLLHRCDIAYAAEPLAYYRVHGSNTTATTGALILDLGFAYAFTAAYQRMANDSRYTPRMRTTLLQRIRARVLDVCQNPAPIPASWRFAAEVVYQVVPNKRLLPSGAATPAPDGPPKTPASA